MSLAIWCVGVFLMILGIVQLTEFVLLFCNRPTWEVKRYLTIPLSGHIENIEQLVRYLRIVSQWEDGHSEVLILDIGMDESSRRLCLYCCEEHEELHLLTVEQLVEQLQKQ